MTTFAPCSASASTTDFPMPVLPPVTTATLPCNVIDPPRSCGSEPMCRLHAAILLGARQRVVVALVLIGVRLGELGDGLIEHVGLAEVRGDGDAVAGARVRPRQCPCAHPGVERHVIGRHLL